ncbi:hypothetical protein, partial [Haemophilus influenzae]
NWVFMQPKTNTTATVTNWYLGSADWMTIGRWKGEPYQRIITYAPSEPVRIRHRVEHNYHSRDD